jgi:hypothetical protein
MLTRLKTLASRAADRLRGHTDHRADEVAPFVPAGSSGVQLVIPQPMWDELDAHLFCGDHDEHGAVIAAGIVQTDRGMRLVARELHVAIDGVDFVAGNRSHRRLVPEFVNRLIRYCRDEQLAYLAIHNHGSHGAVGFSEIDLRSHERGYPALLDIGRGVPVGGLVIAKGALAGDIWLTDGTRVPVGETVILGRGIRRLYASLQDAPPARGAIDDRQARIYGDAGQALLGRMKIGVVGCGGVGMLIVAMLARMGVGHLVLIDPDRVELTNLPRLLEARRRDAMAWLTGEGRPAWMQALGRALSARKVALAGRVARNARPGIRVDEFAFDVSEAQAAGALRDCDYVFLAADSHTARSVFNALIHQYLICGAQIGSKVEVKEGGEVGSIFSVVRPVTPAAGCLWCNGLISPSKLTEESLPEAVSLAQRYLPEDDAPAPSVMSLNAIGAAQAVNHFMLKVTGLLRDTDTADDYRRYETRGEQLMFEMPRRDSVCAACSTAPGSILARGDAARLPVKAER